MMIFLKIYAILAQIALILEKRNISHPFYISPYDTLLLKLKKERTSKIIKIAYSSALGTKIAKNITHKTIIFTTRILTANVALLR